MTTIKEIAFKSKYSSSTVSRVLNHDQTLAVSQEAKEKIFSVAKELGYKTVQERKGRSSKNESNKGGKIGIVTFHSIEEELNDAYFLSIRQGIEKQCIESNVEAVELLRMKNIESDRVPKDVKHLIVVGRVQPEVLEIDQRQFENIVYINHSVDDSKYDSVVVDFERATYQALEHLLDAGYQKIGFIGGQEYEYAAGKEIEFEEGRRAAFQKVLESKGIYQPDLCRIGHFSISEGYRLMLEMLQENTVPEAVFAASDAMGIGAIRALKEQGYKVPEDVAIVGFNDIEMAEYSSPPLTTIHVHTEEMGRTGVKLMMDRLKGRRIPMKVTLPTHLVVRDSCGVSL
ncbi:LacI family DNA-binding transcriptional regulator [Halobacillus kuroshimensis]|uniref:LacI family DNA-binding transcriptional regulator n=1 Tax=Halobacillus kuroshimensis TaxID=302481 RepID=UPI00040EF064|nr:LacI family DNA-binding transcriptional regulator [Halobacillus kuroshimensis]